MSPRLVPLCSALPASHLPGATRSAPTNLGLTPPPLECMIPSFCPQLIRAAFSGGGGLCFLEHLGITIGQGCGRPGASGPAAALAAKVEGATGKLTGLLESPLPRHKDVPANLRRLLLGDPGGCLAFGC